MTALTTHVLDTATGLPARGMHVELYSLESDRRLLSQVETNEDGRCDEPMLSGEGFRNGMYELVFDVGAYFGPGQDDFLNEVVVRFRISDEGRHYHVPLLVSPFSYTTYRGS